jgi:hypothetical protein
MTDTVESLVPAWFKYRQGEASPAGHNCYKLAAPLSDDAYICVREQDGKWLAAVKATPDGPDIHATEPKFEAEADAWRAAFELYRATVIY